MRDIHTYPITKDEIENCLTMMADAIVVEQAVGDMRPTLLYAAARIVHAQSFIEFDPSNWR